jgi:hypothetical protein
VSRVSRGFCAPIGDPCRSGKGFVNLVETAAQEHKLRLSGFVAVRELDSRIKQHHIGGGE